MSTPHLMVMAGGTGGHIFPGIAVADQLRSQGWKVTWLGNRQGMEGKLVPAHGYELESVQFGGLRGKGIVTKLLLPMNLLRAFAQSLGVLRRIKPDVILGMGGYITFPAGMMAVLLGRPLVLHEQNSVAGLANRVLAKVADIRLVAFPGALDDAEWVGNPIRAAISACDAPETRYVNRQGPLQVLVVGGSLGAKVLNETLPTALAQIPQEHRPTVIHQTGRGNVDSVNKAYQALGIEQVQVTEFIADMATAYASADLVISRAGAMAVSEIAACGVASVLVPFPHAVDDHQTHNAQFLAKEQAAILLPQDQLNAESLSQIILKHSREDFAAMAVKARSLAKLNATQSVATVCEHFVIDRKAA